MVLRHFLLRRRFDLIVSINSLSEKALDAIFPTSAYLLHLVENLGSNRQVLKSGMLERCLFNLSIVSPRALTRERSLVASL